VFLLAQRWQSRWLLALTVLIFAAVLLLPVARSARRRHVGHPGRYPD